MQEDGQEARRGRGTPEFYVYGRGGRREDVGDIGGTGEEQRDDDEYGGAQEEQRIMVGKKE